MLGQSSLKINELYVRTTCKSCSIPQRLPVVKEAQGGGHPDSPWGDPAGGHHPCLGEASADVASYPAETAEKSPSALAAVVVAPASRHREVLPVVLPFLAVAVRSSLGPPAAINNPAQQLLVLSAHGNS